MATLLKPPRIPLIFLAARAHCWLMGNLSPTSTPRSLSTGLLSSRSAPSLWWCMGLFLPRCRTLHLRLLSLLVAASVQKLYRVSSSATVLSTWKISWVARFLEQRDIDQLLQEGNRLWCTSVVQQSSLVCNTLSVFPLRTLLSPGHEIELLFLKDWQGCSFYTLRGCDSRGLNGTPILW